MRMLAILVQLLSLVCLGAATEADQAYYRAAVVDYHVRQDASLPALDVVKMNLAAYDNLTSMAHQNNADIIVFPEAGLGDFDREIFTAVPDPAMNITPALNSSCDLVLRNLSQIARTHQIYMVVNLHENYTDPSTKEILKYNTNVVFNRQGTVIARYRKTHLYGEQGINTTKEPEYSIFDTDFGVKFGQFICFDIMFKEPALTLVKKHGISNFVYPSHWYSELPFYTSVQTQWAWAVGNNVNLLSAGVNNITNENGGSSIIRGARTQTPLFTYKDEKETTLLIINVPKNSSSIVPNPQSFQRTSFQGFERLRLAQQPGLNETTSKLIDIPVNNSTSIGNIRFNENICHGELCCTFNLSIAYDPRPVDPMVYYRAVAFGGLLGVLKGKYYVQYCAIVTCTTNVTVEDCGKLNLTLPLNQTKTRSVKFSEIDISGNFITADANPQPNVLLWPYDTYSFLADPGSVNFTSKETSTQIIYNQGKQIITVGIHSRVFSRDNPGGNGAFGIKSSNFVALLAALIQIAAKSLPF